MAESVGVVVSWGFHAINILVLNKSVVINEVWLYPMT